jgi:nitrite reductase/ring-hydroxylating ferredoxin subunit
MEKRILVGESHTFVEGRLTTVDAEGTSVIVTRVDGQLCAVRNRCTHLPLPLAGGRVEGGEVVCPWHNSRFDVCSGENRDWVAGLLGVGLPGWSRRLLQMGRRPAPLTIFRVDEENGQVFVHTGE